MRIGQAAVDWQERINPTRMREERLAKLQQVMKRHGLPCLLLNRLDNFRYTTGMRGLPYPQINYSLIFAEHEPIIYLLGDSLEQNKVNCPWVKPENRRLAYTWWGGMAGPAAVADESKRFAGAIRRDLEEKGLDKEKLGLDMIDEPGRAALTEAGIKLAPASGVMMEARRTKTQDEINCIRMACTMGNIGYSTVCQTLRPGMTENAVSAEAIRAMRRAGAEFSNAGVTSGPRCFEMGHVPNSDRIIEFGDLLYALFCSTSYLGYQTCYYRSFIVGRKPNDKEKDWNRRCYERVHSVIGAIKPGATTADAAKHFLPASHWGYDDERRLLAGELGHGVGLGTHEEPVISRVWSLNYPQVFEKDMVVAVESREGEAFVGGVRIEQMVVVTETGSEIITTWPCKDLMAVGVLL